MIGLVPKPEHFTELYLDSYPHISPVDALSDTPISFVFVIANHEGTDMTYAYTIFFINDDGQTSPIASGTVFGAADTLVKIPQGFTISTGTRSGKVVIELPLKNQHVDFWIPTKSD